MAKDPEQKTGVSKIKLAVGAASLFLFLVGVKRSFRTEEGREIRQTDVDWPLEDGESPANDRHRLRSARRS